ncbi:hypothetical protein JRQ81_009689 [Phrynocephalus forsythii]|uniref:Uncharacterized protein n=1 Tax=Phrynocephalus forsythii TaxID=171643 RepID=A0A9Q0X8P8_9SAUR|nr:hypothetical protein JRQ81_009689 [Phrynocephalus forsythii]
MGQREESNRATGRDLLAIQQPVRDRAILAKPCPVKPEPGELPHLGAKEKGRSSPPPEDEGLQFPSASPVKDPAKNSCADIWKAGCRPSSWGDWELLGFSLGPPGLRLSVVPDPNGMSQSGVKRWLSSFLRKKATLQDLPEEVLLEILSWVPKRDLILNCRLVCSQWRELVDQPVLWKRKCERLGIRPKMPDGTDHDWRTFYLRHSVPNLVKNPCGQENLDYWDLHGTSWVTVPYRLPFPYERIPCPPPDVQRCFVVSSPTRSAGGQGVKSQRITLRDEGYSDRLMDETRPRIVVKDWFYIYYWGHCELHVKLLSAEYEVLQECHLTGQPQWWCQVCHTFDDYPSGVRHIDLEHKASWYKCSVEITDTSVTIDPEVPASREGRSSTGRPLRKNSFFDTLCPLGRFFRETLPEGPGSSRLRGVSFK